MKPLFDELSLEALELCAGRNDDEITVREIVHLPPDVPIDKLTAAFPVTAALS